jgi:hypothetical protein
MLFSYLERVSMPAEANEPVQPAQDKDAPTSQASLANPQTTTTTTEQSGPDIRGIMDFLDIPKEVQARVAPVTPEPEPEPEKKVEAAAPEPPTEPEPLKAEQPEETEEDDEEDAEAETELPPAAEQPQKIDKRQKRINRLTRQKAELTEQLDRIAIENQKLRQQLGGSSKPEDQPAPLVGGRLPSIEDEIKKADAILAWCDDNAEGGQLGEGEKAQYYDAKAIRSWRREAEIQRQDRVVEKSKELDRLAAVRSQADMEAFRLWPEMFDKTKPEYQEAVGYIQRYPFLVNVPEANLALGMLIEGGKSLKAKASNNGIAPNGQKPHKDIDERAFTTPRAPIAPHTPEPPARESAKSSSKKFNEAMSNLVKDQDNSDKWLAEAFGALDEQNRGAVTAKTQVKT